VVTFGDLAEAQPGIQVSAGTRGLSRSGRVLPVLVTLEGDLVDRQLSLVIEGSPAVRRDVELPRQTTKRVFLHTLPERGFGASDPVLRVFEGGEVIREEALTTELLAFSELVAVVGGQWGELQGFKVVQVAPADLSDRARGFDALSALVVFPDAWRQISAPSLGALARWVADGGHVILPLQFRGAKLKLDGTHVFGPIEALEGEVRAGVWKALDAEAQRPTAGSTAKPPQLRPKRADSGTVPPFGVWRPPPAWDRVALQRLPSGLSGGYGVWRTPTERILLSAQRQFGNGRLTFLAFDPFQTNRVEVQKGRAGFLKTVLSTQPMPKTPEPVRNFVLPTERPGVRIGWFVVFLLSYLLLVGPVDYWFIRRQAKPILTWVTFPVVVVIACLVAWGLGRGRIGGLEYREATFVDFSLVGEQVALARSFVGVYSDVNAALRFRPAERGGEVAVLESGSGAEQAFLQEGSTEDLMQRMYIWAYHGYRVTWLEQDLLLSAHVASTENGSRITVDSNSTQEPMLAVVSWGDAWYRLSARVNGSVEGRWLASLEPAKFADIVASLPPLDFGTSGEGGLGGDFLRSFLDPRDQRPCLIQVFSTPWPALELVGREPAQTRGVSVVRCRVDLRAREN